MTRPAFAWHLGMDWGEQTDRNNNVKVGTPLKISPNVAGFDYFYGYTHARNIGTVVEQDKVEAIVEEVETQPRLAKKIVAYFDDPVRRLAKKIVAYFDDPVRRTKPF